MCRPICKGRDPVKRKLRKRISAALIITALALIAAASAVFAASPSLRYTAGEYLGLNTRKITLAKVSPELKTYGLGELRDDSRVTFDQSLLLVNGEHPIQKSFVPELTEYKTSGVEMNRCAVKAYASLSAAVSEETERKLCVMSSVRDGKEQAELYNNDPDTAAAPNASEHLTGLGLDVYVKNYAGSGFIKSPAGQFVNSNSWRYGFIIRYPSYGKSSTGISFEPWHLRYVGEPHAKVIYNNRLTLEVYIGSLEEGEWYSADGYLVSRQREGGALELPGSFASAVISPDNTGCYIITVRTK